MDGTTNKAEPLIKHGAGPSSLPPLPAGSDPGLVRGTTGDSALQHRRSHPEDHHGSHIHKDNSTMSRMSRMTSILTPNFTPANWRRSVSSQGAPPGVASTFSGAVGVGNAARTPSMSARRSNLKFIADQQKHMGEHPAFGLDVTNRSAFHMTPALLPSTHNQFGLNLNQFGATTPEFTPTPDEDEGMRASDRVVTREEMVHGFVYGLVNFVMCIPVLVSYTYIVFADPKFSPYIPGLYKVMLLSSALCQFVFCRASQMPFAVGQVQDVGLIFLQAMTRLIQEMGDRDGLSEDAIVATCLVQCGIATALTGLVVFIGGRFKVGDYVRLLPLPVVGGYLGYIGYFCLAAGLSVTTGEQIQGPDTYHRLFQYALVWKLALCALFTCMMQFVDVKIDHWLASPALFLLIPVVSNIAVWAMGYSHLDAEHAGWFPPPDPDTGLWSTIAMYDFTLVQWSYIPRQVGSMVGLFIVVSFGSSLDICAIQSDYPVRLNFNKELETVGIANIVSGCFGGFTGSYIFTQTLFSMKGEVRSMMNGFVIGVGELLMFLMPLDVTPWLPNAYVGAILCFFGLDILADWLYRSRRLVSKQEFAIIWFTFLCVVFLSMASSFGVLEGMVLGCMLAALVFTVLYARIKVYEVLTGKILEGSKSAEERSRHAAILNDVLPIKLRGYVFFGTTMQFSHRIEKLIKAANARFVILDMRQVVAIDGTAAMALTSMQKLYVTHGVHTILTGVKKEGEKFRMLLAHGMVTEDQNLEGVSVDNPYGFAICLETINCAMIYCEELLLQYYGLENWLMNKIQNLILRPNNI